MDQDQNSFFEEEEYSDIINRYKDMLRKNRSCFFDIYEFENIIDYYILNNDYKSALKSVRTGLNQHPYSISLKLKYAQVLIEDKKSKTALEILNEIEKVDSHNFEFHLMKGKALNFLKRILYVEIINGKIPKTVLSFIMIQNNSLSLPRFVHQDFKYS